MRLTPSYLDSKLLERHLIYLAMRIMSIYTTSKSAASRGTLFCPGAPGVRKTSLRRESPGATLGTKCRQRLTDRISSLVIHKLCDQVADWKNVVACFY